MLLSMMMQIVIQLHVMLWLLCYVLHCCAMYATPLRLLYTVVLQYVVALRQSLYFVLVVWTCCTGLLAQFCIIYCLQVLCAWYTMNHAHIVDIWVAWQWHVHTASCLNLNWVYCIYIIYVYTIYLKTEELNWTSPSMSWCRLVIPVQTCSHDAKQ